MPPVSSLDLDPAPQRIQWVDDNQTTWELNETDLILSGMPARSGYSSENVQLEALKGLGMPTKSSFGRFPKGQVFEVMGSLDT